MDFTNIYSTHTDLLSHPLQTHKPLIRSRMSSLRRKSNLAPIALATAHT